MKIDGREIAKKILEDLKIKVRKLNVVPHLAIILVGNDPASKLYVKQKILTAEKIGIKTSLFQYANSISAKVLLSRLNDLNHLSNVHGIIVQQPLPQDINLKRVVNAIDPKKDVDGFRPKSKFQTPIAMSVLKILEEIRQACHLRGGVAPQANVAGTFDVPPAAHLEGEFNRWLKSKKIVIIGKGETGGKPIIDIFEKMDIKPQIIDSKTKTPEKSTKKADIIICAVGKANILKPQMLKKGVILIGIGISARKNAKLMGDYAENEVKNIASFYTPTPGGVGPINVAILLKNLIKASENSTVDKEYSLC